MADILSRLKAALPKVSAWIDNVLTEYAPQSIAVESLALPRLANYFSGSLLRDARAVVVPQIPFPPVSAYGIPEFEALAAMPMAGITFRNMLFVHESHASESVYFHELVHVIQWATLGVDDFLLTYGVGVLQHGYDQSPLEAIAFGLQAQFEQGTLMRQVAETIASEAFKARASTAALFHQHGLTMRA